MVDAILTLKEAFDKPIQEDRHALDNVIVSHYCKVIEFSSEGWLVPISGGCQSQQSISCSPCVMYKCVLQLPENHYVDKVDALLINDVNSTYEQSTDTECADVK